jgi:hypothetical protein
MFLPIVAVVEFDVRLKPFYLQRRRSAVIGLGPHGPLSSTAAAGCQLSLPHPTPCSLDALDALDEVFAVCPSTRLLNPGSM